MDSVGTMLLVVAFAVASVCGLLYGAMKENPGVCSLLVGIFAFWVFMKHIKLKEKVKSYASDLIDCKVQLGYDVEDGLKRDARGE